MEREQFEKLLSEFYTAAHLHAAHMGFSEVTRKKDEQRLEAARAAVLAYVEGMRPRWISVRERLPDVEDYNDYSIEVTAFSNGVAYSPSIVYRASEDFNQFRTWYHNGNPLRGVTHWMPLPETPQDGETG